MRFAGSRMEGFMNNDGPDYGAMAANQDTRNTEFVTASNDAQAKVGATGINTAGAVEAAGILGAAQAGLAGAQGQASIMEGIGGIASSALGAFGGGGTGVTKAVDDLSSGVGRVTNNTIGNVGSFMSGLSFT